MGAGASGQTPVAVQQPVTSPTDVVTSPTSSAFARQHNDDTDSVATSGGQYSRYQDALTPPLGGRVSSQRNEVCPDLTSGGQDIGETDAEIVQDLRVNLPPDGSGAAAICDTSKDDILAKIWTAEEYLVVCIYFSHQCFKLDVIIYYWS